MKVSVDHVSRENMTGKTSRRNHRRWLVALASLSLLAFSYGVAVGQYHLWPRQHIVDLHSYFFESPPKKATWFDEVFVDPAIAEPIIYKAITDEEGLRKANEMMFMRVDEYAGAYDTLTLGDVTLFNLAKRQILRVPFEYQDRKFVSYAYAPKGLRCGTNRTAVLMIPGTGFNVSTAMLNAREDDENFGGIHVLFDHADNAFIFVKPNEDFLAVHNGFGRKLGINYIANYHLNLGGSYSASYLVQAAAVVKYLKSCHGRVGVAGYSQGGAASLLLGLLAQPDFAIVASGHSVIHNDVPISGPDQISGLVEYGKLNRTVELRNAISQRPDTRFLFTWGLKDSSSYQIETQRKPTINALADLPNVETMIHPDGHILPGPTMRLFLEKNGYPSLDSNGTAGQ
jgi:hypothetical protein